MEPIRCFFLEPTGDDGIHGKLFRRSDTGDLTSLAEAPVGAMWFADWMLAGIPDIPGDNRMRGPDGHCLIVRVPDNRDWMVDGRCSNCTMPNDNTHKCWVRHGVPPDITVDKNGLSCQAGAGSIVTPNWHGFLRNGYLVSC